MTYLDINRHALDVDYGDDVADRAMEIAYNMYNVTIARGDTPAAFAQVLREHAERTVNANLENALNSIALDIEHGTYAPAPATAMPAAPVFFAPPAPHPAGPGGVQDIAHHLLEIERRPDGTLSTEGLASTAYALLHGQLDYPGYTQIPPGPERAQAMQSLILAFSGVVEDALGFPITSLEVAPPAPAPVAQFNAVPQDIQNQDTNALLLALGDMTVADNVTNTARRYIQGNTPEDLAVLPQLIRTANVGLHENFDTIARELMARQIEQHLAQTAAQQEPVAIGQALIRVPYNELQQAMTDTERRIADNVSTRISSQAAVFGIDGAEVADMIRNRAQTYGDFTTDLSMLGPQALEVLARDTSDTIEAQNRARNRRGPFQHGGSMAVRGLPLGNLNIRPSITADALRGPDTQPISNFIQQVKGMPGVTKEGTKTGLMAFEDMDPNTRMTKAAFVRELLPSSYEIVDLRDAAKENVHLDRERIDDELDVADVVDAFTRAYKVPDEYLGELADGSWDDLSAGAKKFLAKKKIRNEEQFDNAMGGIREEIIDDELERLYGDEVPVNGYVYTKTQRLVKAAEGDQYGEYGVTHPDQQGGYKHYDNAPAGTMGHFRGAYNPTASMTLAHWDANGTAKTFKTLPNSYVIEEIQSDVQKPEYRAPRVTATEFLQGIRTPTQTALPQTAPAQVGHLHQVHGLLFKAAVQKALELGADTVYLPTAKTIANDRRIPRQPVETGKFAPIYDQAIVKEGLKPLLKIPGVTSNVVNGYHEIRFSPEAKEHIRNGPGQTIPGYAKGGIVH
jgi:hypothetical protein